ncbi:DNA-protecting protein DprA [Neobacillus piezotolerans]|uniref:DNA-protecting protein DprA n=1 Tax=Neobacillus piezotolerans TaxID=2259171 RepID=A0A3D8GWY6_9BACI|nr:DNA-processing protein DprA [Neobacillus piezotolerans]RDU38566.1 DNA-protecting protein DprA [Neobacillus piezotolerans]
MERIRRKLIGFLHRPDATWNSVGRMMKAETLPDSLASLAALKLLPPLKKTDSIAVNHINPPDETFSTLLQQYKSKKISIITILDPGYPELLKQIYQPPWALFACGDLSLLNASQKLAVVGSRQATDYGKNAIRLLFPELIEKGIVIVSGLAKGVDTAAHECAIRNGGKTIAVIAGGLYHVYPEENRRLASEMMKNQLVLSEYPPGTKPARWHFPMRNRIISGLCGGTFIVEAKNKSGSLITANYAVHEGRDVFSLPGSIFSPFSAGANELIQHGAKLVTRAEDILDELRY